MVPQAPPTSGDLVHLERPPVPWMQASPPWQALSPGVQEVPSVSRIMQWLVGAPTESRTQAAPAVEHSPSAMQAWGTGTLALQLGSARL
jgi:hypothetical protein